MNQPPPTRRSAFTVIELLIATSITVLMMFLINRLFFDTVNAVGQGAQLSRILAASRAISDQIQQDTDAMAGPSEGGFLVIINRRIENVEVLTDDGPITVPNVRSDQLVFIRRADDLEPLTPGNTTSFSNGTRAPYARLWYGHALRTNPTTGLSDPGEILGINAFNDNATRWILGRQALLLAGSSASTIHVSGATYGDLIGTDNFYLGYSDVSNLTLADLTSPGGEFYGGSTDPNDVLSQINYKLEAYRYAFPPPDSNVEPGEHLRVNPVPGTQDFTSQQIAQMHPYLMENVSDFVIEFAMDTDNDDGIDQLDVDGNGNLIWFGLDSTHTAIRPAIPALHALAGPAGAYDFNARSFLALGFREERFTFRHDYRDYWPHLIRIRYRLHDPNGRYEEYVGDSVSGRIETGKWFEQIIVVNRD